MKNTKDAKTIALRILVIGVLLTFPIFFLGKLIAYNSTENTIAQNQESAAFIAEIFSLDISQKSSIYNTPIGNNYYFVFAYTEKTSASIEQFYYNISNINDTTDNSVAKAYTENLLLAYFDAGYEGGLIANTTELEVALSATMDNIDSILNLCDELLQEDILLLAP